MKICLYALITVLLASACVKKTEPDPIETEIKTINYVSQGDSTLYGLACDGCNDSILVFLPDSGGDPVKYNITNARRNNQYFGRPDVGDKMALMINPDNPNEVLMVIDMERLCGTWVFTVMPEMRKLPTPEEKERIEATYSSEERQRFDSLLATLMVPREYGYTFKRDHTATSVGGPPRKTALDEDAPVVYPTMRRYTEWHVFNGKIIFSYGGFNRNNGGTQQNMQLQNDTAQLLLLHPDTMVIQFPDRIQGFRLRPDSIKAEN